MLTAEEFERGYAERGHITVETLRSYGRVVRPCHCGEEFCEGWQSVRPNPGQEWPEWSAFPRDDPRFMVKDEQRMPAKAWATMDSYLGLQSPDRATLQAWPGDGSSSHLIVLPCGRQRVYVWPDGVPEHSEECLCGTLPYRHWFVRYEDE